MWTSEFPVDPGLYAWFDPETKEMGFRTYGPLQYIPPDTDIPITTHKDLLFGPIPDPPL